MSLPLLHAGRTNPGLSAALDLRFALDKSLTAYRGPTPSFSRASTGSYFDGSGVLRYANFNLFSYSEQFNNAAWSKNQLSVTANAAIDPLGGSTADKLVEDSSNNYHAIRSALAATAGTTYTMSVYAKAGERNWLIINPSESGIDDRFTWFNISNGTVGTNATGNTATITPVGNGWYRCSVTRVMAVSNPLWFFEISAVDGVRGYLGNGVSGIYIWGAQLEASSTVGTYVPTTNAANSAPRFNHTYNGTSWVSKGLLVEEQRTNSISYSNSFATGFTSGSAQLTSGAANSPDGTANGWKLYESASGSGSLDQRRYGNYTITGQNTISIYAKAAERRRILLFANGPNQGAWFDLVSGTAGNDSTWTGATQSIQNVGNGWYRCVMTTGVQATTIQIQILLDGQTTNGGNRVGDGVSGVYIGHIQGESGAFATSLISTNGSTATRSADVCQITGSDFSSFWNASEGSFAVEGDIYLKNTIGAQAALQVDDGTNNERIALVFSDSGATNSASRYYIADNGSTQVLLDQSTSLLPNTPAKLAVCYKVNDFAFTQDGSAVLTDTSGTLPTVNLIRIGSMLSANSGMSGHIARLRYFNKRLPNATLQLLSEPDPTLNLQFALNKTLTPVAGPAPSFSRASTGSYFNASGVLTSASINTPRFDHVYSGGQWVSRGLLIEEQRTNLLRYSESLDNWTYTAGVTVSANSIVSPDGTLTADKVEETSTTGAHRKYEYYAGLGAATYTWSIYTKAGERSWIILDAADDIAGDFFCFFNLSTGTVGTLAAGCTGSIVNVGNGWFRCVVTRASNARPYFQVGTTTGDNISSFTGTAGSGAYFWGGQLEVGSFATSYISNLSTSTTVRSADVCQITGTSFGWMWNQGEGSVAVEAGTFSNSSAVSRYYYFDDTATGNQIIGAVTVDATGNSGGDYFLSFASSPSYQAFLLSQPARPSAKSAFGWKLNDFASSLNGAAVLTDLSGTIPTGINRLTLGATSGSAQMLNGHIAKLIYYPARLTNTKLQQLST